jgi:cytochrome b561
MQARNSVARYGAVAMTFHWLIALLVIGNLCSGFYLANIIDDADTLKFTLIQLHKSIGLTVLMLSILRLGWRLINPIPPLPAGMSPVMKLVARATHWLFYFFIIAIPAAGWAWASSSTRGIPTLYFGLFQWPNIPFLANLPNPDKTANGHMFHAYHAYFAYSAAVLLVLHIGAALYHHLLRRDNVLRRMWPGTTVEGQT